MFVVKNLDTTVTRLIHVIQRFHLGNPSVYMQFVLVHFMEKTKDSKQR